MPIDVTKKYVRVRIRSPKKCDRSIIRKKTFSKREGIDAVVCCPKGKAEHGRCSVGMITQSVLYRRPKWTRSEAVKHAKHFR